MKKVYARITKQIGFSYLSTVILFLINPLLVLVLTRALSVADYGVFSILAVTVGVAGVLLELGLSQYIVARLAGAPPRERAKSFFSLSTFLMLFLLVAFALILLTPLEGVLLRLLRLTAHPAEFRIALAIVLCVTLTRLLTAYLTAKKHLVQVNFIFTLGQTMFVLLVLAAFGVTRTLSVITVMFWWFIGALVTLLFCGWVLRREFAHFHRASAWSPKLITEALLFSVPLLLFISGSWAMEIGDRYMLNGFLGSEAVGLYTLVYTLLGVIATLGNIVAQTFFPYIATAWNQRKNYQVYLNAAVKYSLIMVIPAMAGFLALRTQLVSLVSGDAYREAANIIPGLLLYPLLSELCYILYQLVLLRRRTVLIGVTYGLGAALNIALNYVLIPRFAMTGAAIATVASYALVFAVLAWSARKSVRPNYGFLKLGRITLAAAVMGIAVWLFNPETAVMKIAAMLGGAALYFGMLFAFRVFSREERELLGTVLPGPVKRLLPWLSS